MLCLDPIQQYFAELAQFPHLSDEEVQALSEQIAQARRQQQPHIEAQARHQLVEGLLTEVLPTAQKYAARMPRLSLLDLIQQGNYGLLLAAERYDFSDTTRRFGAYALTYIRGMIKRDLHQDGGLSIPSASFYTLRAQGKLDPVLALAPLSLERTRSEKDEGWSFQTMLAAPPLCLSSEPVDAQENQRIHLQVESLLATLPAREQRVLRLRYGLDEQDGRTLDHEDVACELGLSVTQVTSIETNALRRLRDAVGVSRLSTCSPRRQAYHHQRKQEQQARLHAAYEQLQAQGVPITQDALRAAAHVDNVVAAEFLRSRCWNGKHWKRIDASTSSQERLEAAYAQLVESGDVLSITRLKAAAHVGAAAARRFLRSRGVPVLTWAPTRKADQIRS